MHWKKIRKYKSGFELPGWKGGLYLTGAPEVEEGQVRQRGHWVCNSCLEILLQIEMSLQMQEHSVPMQL